MSTSDAVVGLQVSTVEIEKGVERGWGNLMLKLLMCLQDYIRNLTITFMCVYKTTQEVKLVLNCFNFPIKLTSVCAYANNLLLNSNSTKTE